MDKETIEKIEEFRKILDAYLDNCESVEAMLGVFVLMQTLIVKAKTQDLK